MSSASPATPSLVLPPSYFAVFGACFLHGGWCWRAHPPLYLRLPLAFFCALASRFNWLVVIASAWSAVADGAGDDAVAGDVGRGGGGGGGSATAGGGADGRGGGAVGGGAGAGRGGGEDGGAGGGGDGGLGSGEGAGGGCSLAACTLASAGGEAAFCASAFAFCSSMARSAGEISGVPLTYSPRFAAREAPDWSHRPDIFSSTTT